MLRISRHPLLILLAAVALSAGGQGRPLAAQSRIDELLRSRLEWNQVAWSGGMLNVGLVRPDADTSAPHPVVFALPWGSGTADLVETFVASYWLTDPGARGYYVVAPEVRGSTLEQTADQVIPAIFAWMDAQLDYDADRVALVGASNGGRGAFFAAVSQPGRFGAIMTLPGGYEGPAEDLEVLEGTPIYFLVGERDGRWIEMAAETQQALESHGIASEFWIAPGQPHVIRLNPAALMDWIDSALEP